MKFGITFRLVALGAAIAGLALLIGVGAYLSQREVGRLRERFGQHQAIGTYEIADHVQKTILELSQDLVLYQQRHDPADLDRFWRDSQQFDDWMNLEKAALQANELSVFAKIDSAFDSYLATATNTVNELKRNPTGEAAQVVLGNIITAAGKMLDLGSKLEDAHRLTLGRSLSEAQASVAFLEQLILVALFLFIVLGLWLSLTVYREMIAPLRLKLVESQEIAERHEKLAALGMLAAGVAHEIRNPLTAIKARLYTLQKKLKDGTPEQDDAKVISQEIIHLELIVKDFLLFARPSDPQREITPADLPLRQVQELLGETLDKNNIQLVREEGPAAAMQIDRNQIKQVLINLVQNAAESIGQNGTVKLRAITDTRRLAGQMTEVVILEVEDNGNGIPPEVQKRLFDPFFTTKETGTGLGLPIAARIVENHHGAIQYQTKANNGTTFGIILPRLKAHESNA